MIISIDVETAGLNAQNFLMACLLKEGVKTPEYFKTKEALWKRVIRLGKAEAKRGKILTIYSHYAQYDTACYVDLKDKGMKFYSNSPLIWSYMENGKEIIKFLDTYSLFRMSLKKIGQLINLPKLEMPNEYYNENTKFTQELYEKTKPYILRDCEICLNSVLFLKEKLKQDRIFPKRIMTINQIAINYMIKKLLNLEDKYREPLFWNKKIGETRRTFRSKEIHQNSGSLYLSSRFSSFLSCSLLLFGLLSLFVLEIFCLVLVFLLGTVLNLNIFRSLAKYKV